ncbi:hypothetical protein K492DRAFT_231866 [Lichtheimia hyalospora FSU 10163]|nr:hypothetical protein K492DRAFT_231866 [Lichtheimia hyalospora FSU 10163]
MARIDQGDPTDKPIRRRIRQALSCQRCRKHRSKCSRSRPSCDQCIAANVVCEYLDAPGDLSSTALRDRFYGLEDQIQSLMNEFDIIEKLVYDREPISPTPAAAATTTCSVQADALRSWRIQSEKNGISIETHMHHVEEIYAALIQFALDNGTARPPLLSSTTATPSTSSTSPFAQVWLTRNNNIYPTVKLSHFTSLLPSSSGLTPPSSADTEDDNDAWSKNKLSRETIMHLMELYPHCLLHGSIPEYTRLLHDALLDRDRVSASPVLQLLLSSCLCNMLLHAYGWHSEIFHDSNHDTMTMDQCARLSQQYYDRAKDLLSQLYFEEPNVMICHALCNLVLFHIESGNTSLIYMYTGMAVRMAASLDMQDEAAIRHQLSTTTTTDIAQYTQSVRWFLYFLDTSASHYHNKPYEVHLDNPAYSLTSLHQKQNDYQDIFRVLEFHTCQITRDIRRTCFASDAQHVPYNQVERIEQHLETFQETHLKPLMKSTSDNVWYTRCLYMHRIRHHGHWILLHQTYLPTPLSVERCSASAFALVELFEAWTNSQHPIDCYFRPCIHELKQACEIMEYHVHNNTSLKKHALDALARLLNIILKTPVGDIARTRPFVQRVQHILDARHINTCE